MKKLITAAALVLPLMLATHSLRAQENDTDILSGIAKARQTSDELHNKKAEIENNWKTLKDNYKNSDAKSAATEKTDLKEEAKKSWEEKKAAAKADYEAKKAEYQKQQAAKKAESEAQKAKAKADLEAIKNTWKK